MKTTAAAVFLIVALAFAGCQWAKFSETFGGPQTSVKKDADAPTPTAGPRYAQIGTGTWTDAAGKTHTAPVYVRME